MSWASIGTLGSTQSKTADQASIALTTATNNAPAASVVVIAVACDNHATVDGDESAVSSVTDSVGGNTWTKLQEWCNGNGTLQTGCTVSLWYSVLTNAINTTSTITANLSNSTSRDAAALTAWAFNPGVGGTVTVENTSAIPTDGAAVQAISCAGTKATASDTDNFNRTENPLASPWVSILNNLQATGTEVGGVTAGANARMRKGGVTYDADCWAELTLGSNISNAVGPLLRASTGADTSYWCESSGAGTFVNLYKSVAGVVTEIFTLSSTLTGGQTIRTTAVGNCVLGYRNGTLIAAIFDSAITAAGEAGVQVFSNVNRSDNFAAGNFTSSEYLYIHALAGEMPSTDSFTWDGDYTQFDANGTTAGADDTNITVRGGFRIVTAASDTVGVTNSTSSTRDYAQVMVALKSTGTNARPMFRGS